MIQLIYSLFFLFQKVRCSSEVCFSCKVLEDEVADLKSKLTFSWDSNVDLNAKIKNLQEDNTKLHSDYEKATQQITTLQAEKAALADTLRAEITKAIQGLFSFIS